MSRNEIPTHKKRVLIADDEADARMLISLALDPALFELRLCENGAQAVAECENELPDIAIIDWQMPETDGLRVCKWIKDNSKDKFVPVLILTSQDEIANKVTGLNYGADDYITKPFSIAELRARVDSFLRIKQLTEQLRVTKNLLADREKQLLAMQLAGAAAHELGQPLTSIALNCELLAELSAEDAGFQNALAVIQKESSRLRHVLSRLSNLEHYKTVTYTKGVDILDLS